MSYKCVRYKIPMNSVVEKMGVFVLNVLAGSKNMKKCSRRREVRYGYGQLAQDDIARATLIAM